MPTIQIEANLTPQKLIEAVEQLGPTELEEFTEIVLALRARRKAPLLPKAEADLLQQINEGVPPEKQRRYDELIARRRAETLTSAEYEELLRLTDEMEGFELRRMESLAELARVRQTTLLKLMKDMGLEPPPHR